MVIFDLLVASGLMYFFRDNLSTLLTCLGITCCLTILRMSVVVSYWLNVLDNATSMGYEDKEENK